VFAEVSHANTTQTSPNLSFTAGWTGRTGAKTAAVYKPDGTATASTATTGTVFYGSIIVNTLDGTLTGAWSLSGSSGSQMFDWRVAATRLL
jgi:hypothetical protein